HTRSLREWKKMGACCFTSSPWWMMGAAYGKTRPEAGTQVPRIRWTIVRAKRWRVGLRDARTALALSAPGRAFAGRPIPAARGGAPRNLAAKHASAAAGRRGRRALPRRAGL